MDMLNRRQLRLLCSVLAGVFLLIHVGMIIVFAVHDVTPMVWIDEWVNTADQRLYEGKNSGKNRVVAD